MKKLLISALLSVGLLFSGLTFGDVNKKVESFIENLQTQEDFTYGEFRKNCFEAVPACQRFLNNVLEYTVDHQYELNICFNKNTYGIPIIDFSKLSESEKSIKESRPDTIDNENAVNVLIEAVQVSYPCKAI